MNSKAVRTHSRANFSRCTDAPDLLDEWSAGHCTDDDNRMRVGAACLDWLGAAMHNTVPTLCCMITFIYELQYPVIHFTISVKVLNSPRGLPRDSSKEELWLSYWRPIQRCHIISVCLVCVFSTALGIFYHCMGNMVHYTVFGRKLPLLLLLPYIVKLYKALSHLLTWLKWLTCVPVIRCVCLIPVRQTQSN